jgi:histidine triad (HIT) family protein
MASIFTRIVNGEIPCYKIAETDEYLAFLDVRPQHLGHTLVITKQEIDYIFNVEDDQLAGLMVFAKRVAKAVEKTVPCKRIGIAVVGLEVPHTHIHLMPINNVSDLGFGRNLTFSAEEMNDLAQKITANFQSSIE